MKNRNGRHSSPTRVPLVRGAITLPIMELELEYEDETSLESESDDARTRVRVVRGAKPRPITDLELEYEDPPPPESEQAQNGKPKAPRSKARKKKPAQRGKS